jgi:hypothetical protein
MNCSKKKEGFTDTGKTRSFSEVVIARYLTTSLSDNRGHE